MKIDGWTGPEHQQKAEKTQQEQRVALPRVTELLKTQKRFEKKSNPTKEKTLNDAPPRV